MEPSRTSTVECVGLTMIVSTLGFGILAVIAPESLVAETSMRPSDQR